MARRAGSSIEDQAPISSSVRPQPRQSRPAESSVQMSTQGVEAVTGIRFERSQARLSGLREDKQTQQEGNLHHGHRRAGDVARLAAELGIRKAGECEKRNDSKQKSGE